MIEADRADHSRAKLDHDLIVPITTYHQFHHRTSDRLRNCEVSLGSCSGVY